MVHQVKRWLHRFPAGARVHMWLVGCGSHLSNLCTEPGYAISFPRTIYRLHVRSQPFVVKGPGCLVQGSHLLRGAGCLVQGSRLSSTKTRSCEINSFIGVKKRETGFVLYFPKFLSSFNDRWKKSSIFSSPNCLKFKISINSIKPRKCTFLAYQTLILSYKFNKFQVGCL